MLGPYIFNALQVTIALFALWKGGAPERQVAIMQVAAALATVVSYSAMTVRFYHVEHGVAVVDLLLLIGLVYLALRANRYWPLLMAALQLSSMLAHLGRMADFGMSAWAYAFLLKIWSYPMVLLLAVAVARHRQRVSTKGIDRAWS